jgi:hypothetical protein
MRIHLRGDSVSPKHTRFTVFMNGANCGELCMDNEEAVTFMAAVARGCVNEAFERTGSWPDRT